MYGLVSLKQYLVKYYEGSDAASIDLPMPAITANYEHLGVAEPYLIKYHGNHKGKNDGDRRGGTIDEPLKTLDTSNRYAVAAPYLVQFNGQSETQSVEDPLATITTKDRFGLVLGLFIPQLNAVLDIKFRMLQPHELAAAMSFPKSYHFTGTREQKVKQIGNAVPVRLAEALCRSLLTQGGSAKRRVA